MTAGSPGEASPGGKSAQARTPMTPSSAGVHTAARMFSTLGQPWPLPIPGVTQGPTPAELTGLIS